jgi:hypothetical protein
MASLTNPVNKQNIVDRFADYVVATGNNAIVWGTNARPFGEFTSAYMVGNGDSSSLEPFGGATTGTYIQINGSSIAGTTISAANVYNTLVAETNRYTRIRNLRARLNVTGAGGNNGTRPTAGVVFDQTKKAYMRAGYQQDVGSPDAVANGGVAAGSKISSANLETFFINLRAAYTVKLAVAADILVNVCHASCHSSCHGSRGRR